MSELKPCPFCGGEAAVSICTGGDDESGYYAIHSASCTNCDVSTDSDINRESVIKIWNTRADGWIDLPSTPNESGRYTVNSSYGVRDAYFTSGFTHGDYRWQDCETNNDEGMENSFGEVFTVYSWTQLPTPSVK